MQKKSSVALTTAGKSSTAGVHEKLYREKQQYFDRKRKTKQDEDIK
jgi:hypothetical protein